MTAEGLFPQQNLFFVEAGLIEQSMDDHLIMGGHYRGEWGSRYIENTWSFEIRLEF